MGWYQQEVVEMALQIHVDPRIRAYGKARIDVTRRARDENEWQLLWHEPRFSFPFSWGSGWKHCIQYTVDDFAAEIGFFIDVLGFPVNAFSPSYAQFTSPAGEFFFSIAAALEGEPSTPPTSLRLQFMLHDLPQTIQELERRGITFERKPEPGEGFPAVALMQTPNGMIIELWGTPQEQPSQPAAQPAVQETKQENAADFWTDDLEEEADSDDQETGESKSVEDNPEQVHYEDIDDSKDEEDQPIYIDAEEEALSKDPLASVVASPNETGSHPRPAFPTAVIRRTEDLLKDGLQLPSRKGKGNGMRGFPTTDPSDNA